MSTMTSSRRPRFFARALRGSAVAVTVSLLVAGLIPLSASPAIAAPADFASSFESSDAAPLASTVETVGGVAVQQNLRGETSGSLLTNLLAATASKENPSSEIASAAADGNPNTKWLAKDLPQPATGWLRYQFTQGMTASTYTLTSGNDSPERDPKNFTIEGSNNGSAWTTLDTQNNQSFTGRGQKKTYTVPEGNRGTYTYYRLNVLSIASGNIIQLADFDLLWASGPGEVSPMTTAIGNGPNGGYNLKARVGFTGTKTLRYTAEHIAAGPASATNRLYGSVNIPVGNTSRLSYNIFPELTNNDLQYPTTYTAVDLRFTDGTYLSALSPIDSYGIPATAFGQGSGKILYPNQWNHVEIDLGGVASGKTVDAILLAYDNRGGSATTRIQGWVDDIALVATPPVVDGASLTNYVDTRRGTNSTSAFSRGATEAITAIPNGFNFLVPVTNAMSTSREYSYQSGNDGNNRTPFEGLAISHEPSPWMGDRLQYSVMPVPGATTPSGNSRSRAATFSHDNEVAQPDYYGVTLDNGVTSEMTPTSHGMIMRFTFTGDDGQLVFDAPNADGSFTINPDGTVTGWVGRSNFGATRMFITGSFDRGPTSVATPAGGRANVTQSARFDTSTTRTVTLRMATSFISTTQAAQNLALEVGAKSFDAVRAEAKATWNDRLGVITVDDTASETQLKTLYGNLYRLNLYPNEQFENTGTASAPVYQYASPVSPTSGNATASTTNAKVATGRMYVNNGFWDTYRTVWPAYSLLYPEIADDLIDGFVEQYRDGGWIARWSSPGYADIMTGTSSDVAFADAYLRGVKLIDPLATYDAALKNATAPSPQSSTGRKSLAVSQYLGFTPASQGESVSWAAEGYINDFAIGGMAAKLATDPATPEARKAGLLEQSEYFLERAKGYINIFDPAIGFFQARNANGTFAVPANDYSPLNWWGPYTETNGWNYAFSAPQDPQGVANMYGGRQGLEDKLDAFFSIPETTTGSIHEMVEARDGRYGQWGVSNQVSHHIPFMYYGAGEPSKAQKITREVMQRSFGGSEIGQGYSGDEDNGEMSAWGIFASIGLYPLQTGSSDFVIGSPTFQHATVRLAGGKSIQINAPGNSTENVYVQSVKINGVDQSRVSVDANLLAQGATIDYVLGSTPSMWGTAPEDGLTSLTTGTGVADPLVDTTDAAIATTTSAGGEPMAALVDNSSATQVAFVEGSTPVVTVAYKGATQKPGFYTISSSSSATDPSAWTLEGSSDGVAWTTVDQRSAESFAYRGQLRPFKISNPGVYQQFRLTVTEGAASISMSEFELLTNGAASVGNELAFAAGTGLTGTAGVESSFGLGFVSGGAATEASGYTASVEWGDASATSPVTIGAPTVGNFAATATHTYAKAGVYQARVTVSDGATSRVSLVTITVSYIEPGSLRAAFDLQCIGDDGVGANCDGKGFSFPRAGLVAGGFATGVPLPVPGTDLTFTVPAVPAGSPDSATGAGQVIVPELGTGATRLSFIGAATERNQDTTALVTFTDGTTATIPLQFSDWTKGGNAGATAPYGNIEVLKSAYRLNGGGMQNTASYFFSTVPYDIPAGMTVESITLPVQPGDPGVTGRVHIFAIASNGVPVDQSFTAVAGDAISAVATREVTAALGSVSKSNASATDPQVRVQWGDGTTTEDATITGSGTAFTLGGKHVYATAGTYTVSVTVANGSGTQQLTLAATVAPLPVYTPSLTATPATEVHAGDSVAVAGVGFAPGESVTVTLETPTPVVTTVTADGAGGFSTSVTVASGIVAGTYSIVATGPESAVPATVNISVTEVSVPPVYEPQIQSDSDAARAGDTVTISGSGFAIDETVTVELRSTPQVVGTTTVDRNGAIVVSFQVPADVPAGQHSIVVTGSVSRVPVSIPFTILPAALPGDGSGGGTGPGGSTPGGTGTTGSGALSFTGSDGQQAWALGLGAASIVLFGVVMLLIARRRRRLGVIDTGDETMTPADGN